MAASHEEAKFLSLLEFAVIYLNSSCSDSFNLQFSLQSESFTVIKV